MRRDALSGHIIYVDIKVEEVKRIVHVPVDSDLISHHERKRANWAMSQLTVSFGSGWV